jgi:fatty-acyl-CoA synthase
MGHKDVLEAAVIAVSHPKWVERPLAVVVKREEADPGKLTQELYDLLGQHFARWQLPDKIEFVAAIPKTSVGKFDKKVLREQYKDYVLEA